MIQNLMMQIHEGMTVYDRTGDAVGKVTFIRFGEENPAQPGPETITGSRTDTSESSLVEDIAEVFDDHDLPETIRGRLRRYGYIQIDAGLLASDRLVFPDQVARIEQDGVHLNVTNDELIKP
jgi:hypothetical protein